jgi:hypothetical protein
VLLLLEEEEEEEVPPLPLLLVTEVPPVVHDSVLAEPVLLLPLLPDPEACRAPAAFDEEDEDAPGPLALTGGREAPLFLGERSGERGRRGRMFGCVKGGGRRGGEYSARFYKGFDVPFPGHDALLTMLEVFSTIGPFL